MTRFGACRPLESGWILEGTCSDGGAIRLTFGKTELGRAYLGIVIGRHPALSDRLLLDPGISRRHFRIGLISGAVFVEDLNSLNGTELDGKKLAPFQPTVVSEGQSIVCGNVTLRLRLVSGEADSNGKSST